MNDFDYSFLIELYEEKSITRVAKKQYMTQSALTKRIRSIENELGCELVIRTKRGVVFTSTGEAIVESCRKIVAAQEEMKEKVFRGKGIVGGSLVIGCSTNYARYRLPQILLKYHKLCPQVDLKINVGHSKDMFSMLMSNEIPLAIIRGDYLWDEGKIKIESEPLCLISKEKKSLEDLSTSIFIDHNNDSKEGKMISQWIVNNKINPEKKMFVNDNGAAKEMVLGGVGWSVLPSICLDDFDGYKIPLFAANGEPLKRDTYVMYNSNCQELTQVKKFIETITENINDVSRQRSL